MFPVGAARGRRNSRTQLRAAALCESARRIALACGCATWPAAGATAKQAARTGTADERRIPVLLRGTYSATSVAARALLLADTDLEVVLAVHLASKGTRSGSLSRLGAKTRRPGANREGASRAPTVQSRIAHEGHHLSRRVGRDRRRKRPPLRTALVWLPR